MKNIKLLILLFTLININNAKAQSKKGAIISIGLGAPNGFRDSVQHNLQVITSIKDSTSTTRQNLGPLCF